MRNLLLAGLFFLGLATAATADEKTKDLTMDGMTSPMPKGWVSEEPSNKMRFAQFKIPKAKGDKEDGELLIFRGISGSAKDNIDRWKKQFRAPKGKTLDDVAKVSEIKIGGHDASLLDVTGTYLYNPQPFNPKSKTEERESYRMLAIHFEGPKNVYHIKLTGPAKTIDAVKKDFDAWIKGFKK
jgi:hypothetical protein